ncbi:MAG: hypothetical protein AAFY83_00050 [Pseudomonadota bacterium]
MVRRLLKFGPLGGAILVLLLGGRMLAADERGEHRADRLRTLIENADEARAAATTTTPAQQDGSTRRSMADNDHLLQANISFLAYWNAEDLFLNRLALQGYPDDYRWIFTFADRNLNTKEAEAAGFIDPVSGDLARVPPSLLSLQSPTLLPNYTDFPDYYAGRWVLTWEGSARAEISAGARQAGVRRIGGAGKKGRLVFDMPRRGAAPFRAIFSQVRTPLRNLKLYRLEEEAAAQRGAVWTPAFTAMLSRYDVVRTMLAQGINTSPVRQWADVAHPDDPHFFDRQPILPPEQRPRTGRYGLPYEYILELAAQTRTRAWMHIPLQIGAPDHQGDIGSDVMAMTASAQANADDILKSPAWDEFARELVTRLDASTYPVGQPLYIELGNEVWNYAWPYVLNTRYAEGIARGITTGEGPRYGYGTLTARMILAMETALNTRQSPHRDHIVYVIAGQTAVPETSAAAYRGLQTYWRAQGADVAALTAKTGIALTTYHGGATAYENLVIPRPGETLVSAWEREIDRDPEGLEERVYTHYTRGGPGVEFDKNWVLARWRDHEMVAQKIGVPIIGAYEGGSHDNPPEALTASAKFVDWWTRYHWGPRGVEVVRQVNKAIIARHRGAMLSNFVTHGKVGDPRHPWNDGHYYRETLMSRMWKDFGAKQRDGE